MADGDSMNIDTDAPNCYFGVYQNDAQKKCILVKKIQLTKDALEFCKFYKWLYEQHIQANPTKELEISTMHTVEYINGFIAFSSTYKQLMLENANIKLNRRQKLDHDILEYPCHFGVYTQGPAETRVLIYKIPVPSSFFLNCSQLLWLFQNHVDVTQTNDDPTAVKWIEFATNNDVLYMKDMLLFNECRLEEDDPQKMYVDPTYDMNPVEKMMCKNYGLDEFMEMFEIAKRYENNTLFLFCAWRLNLICTAMGIIDARFTNSGDINKKSRTEGDHKIEVSEENSAKRKVLSRRNDNDDE